MHALGTYTGTAEASAGEFGSFDPHTSMQCMQFMHLAHTHRLHVHASAGQKQDQKEHETPHVIMWWSMITRQCADENLQRTEAAVNQIFQDLKEAKPTMKVSEKRTQIVASLVCKVPDETMQVFLSHMDSRVWERCALNNDICGAKEFQLGYAPPGCVGPWLKMLKNNEVSTCQKQAEVLVKTFVQRNPNEDQIKTKELQSARSKKEDIEKTQAACALYDNWLEPLVKAEDTRILKLVQEDMEAGRLTEDLHRLSLGKSNADLGKNLVLQAIPRVAQHLASLANATPSTEEGRRHHEQDLRKECDKLIEQCETVESNFETYVKNAIGVAQQDFITCSVQVSAAQSPALENARTRAYMRTVTNTQSTQSGTRASILFAPSPSIEHTGKHTGKHMRVNAACSLSFD